MLLLTFILSASLVGVNAWAAPFATTYTSTIGAAVNNTTFPELEVGETFQITLVMDNGGAVATNQTWTNTALECIVFQFNDGGNVVFAQDLAADGNFTTVGTASTDAAGALTQFFTGIVDGEGNSTASNYTAAGFTVTDPVEWYLDSTNDFFVSGISTGTQRGVADSADGIQMAASNWSAPTPFTQSCNALAFLPRSGVPATPTWLLGLLALGVAAIALFRRGFGWH
jgi:hypothetical protein